VCEELVEVDEVLIVQEDGLAIATAGEQVIDRALDPRTRLSRHSFTVRATNR
jgi:hypothetical protein